MEVVKPGGTLLTVTEKGYGKRTELDEYRVQSRGGLGLKNLEITDKNGEVVGIAQVHENEELLVITQQGKILRTPAARHPHDWPRDAGRSRHGSRTTTTAWSPWRLSNGRREAVADAAKPSTRLSLRGGKLTGTHQSPGRACAAGLSSLLPRSRSWRPPVRARRSSSS